MQGIMAYKKLNCELGGKIDKSENAQIFLKPSQVSTCSHHGGTFPG
jgi:hypothetical protein